MPGRSHSGPSTAHHRLLLRRMCDNHPQQWQPRWSTHPLTVACIDSLLYHHPTAAKTTFKFAQPAPLGSQHSIKIKAQHKPGRSRSFPSTPCQMPLQLKRSCDNDPKLKLLLLSMHQLMGARFGLLLYHLPTATANTSFHS